VGRLRHEKFGESPYGIYAPQTRFLAKKSSGAVGRRRDVASMPATDNPKLTAAAEEVRVRRRTLSESL
jgi:hypothetical protein